MVAVALLAVPAQAAAGPIKAGAATVDGSWHVGASAGQYAGGPRDFPPDPNDPDLNTFVEPEDGTYNPTAESYTRRTSYGIQSRLKVRALVVEGPDGNRIALVKNDFYIPQDLIYRRTAQLLEAKPALRIGRANLTMAISHNHSSPFYSSTAWGAWTFQDVFDIRFYNYYAHRMAEAVEKAVANLVPVRVGAAVTQFDKTHRHSFGPAIGDDGTPAGYLHRDTDHDVSVVRFDDIRDPAHPKPVATFVNYGLHPESLDGNDLISGDYYTPMQRYVDDATGGLTVGTQGAVGTSEPERSAYHDIHERLEFTHREYSQAEYNARLMSNAVLAAYHDLDDGQADPQVSDPSRFVPFFSNVSATQVKMKDLWVPGPVSHPYPGVSSCRTDPAFRGDPRLPIVGLPDCEGPGPVLDELEQEGGDGGKFMSSVDPGLTNDDFQRAGIPVPENYSAPSYTGLEEDIDVHVQGFRIGDIYFAICSCELWNDQSKNTKTRTDRIAGDEYLGYDWKTGGPAVGPAGGPVPFPNPPSTPPCTKNSGSGTFGDAGANENNQHYGTGTWKCPNPNNVSQSLPNLADKLVERMHHQVVNPANGWNDIDYAPKAESEETDLQKIRGNYTWDDLCKQANATSGPGKAESDFWDKPCGQGEKSPSADLGYKLTIAMGMANDYNGYIATYREFQNRDHYRKALTGWGPHSSDYLSTRLVNIGRVLNGGDEDKLLPPEYGAGKVALDIANNDARAQALGTTGENAITAYEQKLPDDGGTAGAVSNAAPPDVKRFDGTFFTWVGGSNYTDNPDVKVQRKVGGVWREYAFQDSEVPVTLQFPHGQDEPSYETGSFEWKWTAHLENFAAGTGTKPFDTIEGNGATPVGVYRFVVDGHRRQNRTVVPYHVESKEFKVLPWDGITVNDLKVDGDDHVSFKVGPRTLNKPHSSLNCGGTVNVPEVGPIDYPDTYDYGQGGPPVPRFIRLNREIREDSCAQRGTGELYCTDCRFRPWLDTGDAKTAKVTFVLANGSIQQVDATENGDRWRTNDPLPNGAQALVGKGCVQDPYDDYNGADSAIVGGRGGTVPNGAGCATADPNASAGGGAGNDGGGGSQGGGSQGGGSQGGGSQGGAGGQGGQGNLGQVLKRLLGLSNDRCADPIGSIHGTHLGRTALGRSRRAERSVFPSFDRRRAAVDRFCIDGGGHIRIGYMTPQQLASFSRKRRRSSRVRAVLILTTSPHYKLRGVRHGSRVRTLRKRFRRARSFRIGRNRWYVARGRRVRLVFKTHRGRVEEIGIARLRPTRTPRRAKRFLRSFPG